MIDLLQMNRQELEAFLAEKGQPRYRAQQLMTWMHQGVPIEEMANLPKALRAMLAEETTTCPVRIEKVFVSAKDGTRKYLFALQDGHVVEGVLMRYHYGNTLCISCQVGCRMGCAFCASTLDGCVRNLTASEMLAQVILINREMAEGDRRGVTNIVMMGSGEPMDNYDEVMRFLRLVCSPDGINIAQRNISLSTCGLVPRMRQFADEGMQITLSVSLHAPNDEVRRQLMPVAKVYDMQQVLDACRYYVEKTGRRMVIEYALVKGVNDEIEHAEELSKVLRGLLCHVNLIPLNDVPERGLMAPGAQRVAAFLKALEDRKVSATVRRRMGDDIAGACGQLRRRHLKEQEEAK